MEIRKTKLWKALSPCVRREDWPVLERELRSASEEQECQFIGSSQSLSSAFYWDDSPQGHAFWMELSHRLILAGYGDVA